MLQKHTHTHTQNPQQKVNKTTQMFVLANVIISSVCIQI